MTKLKPTKGGRWALWLWQDIMCTDNRDLDALYLKRLRIIQTPWFALYLHHILEADHDPDPHDHPFNFWSLVLRGGYFERLYPGRESRDSSVVHYWPMSFHKMSKYAAHRITDIRPNTWTLIFVGRRTQDWGYWTMDGFVQFAEYLAQNHPVNLEDYNP